jgi:para-nitrobenzyl esterase
MRTRNHSTPAFASACALVCIAGLVGCGGESEPPTRRATSYGTVEGIDLSTTSGTYAWLGLPFAQAPVGARRWQAPAEPAKWDSVRQAQHFGHSCAQGGRYYSPAPNDAPYGLSVRESYGKPVGDEDCLTLNIWRPAGDQTQLPVIVFIHGGSNISGYSADPIYDGQVLARKANAVVVTINYRLGLFGWLDLSHIKTGDAQGDSGNFGLLDQIQALKYVQGNIGGFGGDAGNVTVMGQSAGAVNVWALLSSPLTAGLMHKAIPLSGGISNATRTKAQTYSTALLNAVIVADGKAINATGAQAWLATQTSAQIGSYFRNLPANQIVAAMLANPQLGNAPACIEDGTVLPINAVAAMAAGQYRKLPVLVGNTKDEGTSFSSAFAAFTGTGVPGFKLSDYDRFGLQFNFDPDAPSALTPADFISVVYLPVTATPLGWNALAATGTNATFLSPLFPQLNALLVQQPGQVWYYRFDWNEEPAPFNTIYGATHALDLPFVFGNFGSSAFSFAFSTANKPGRSALSEAMMQSVAAFARTGNPNHAGLGTTWPNWPAKLIFDATPTQLQISLQ